MACSGCGSELSVDFMFCPRCGRRQQAVCPACGSPCEPQFAFCPRCGRPRKGGGPTTETVIAGTPEVGSPHIVLARRTLTPSSSNADADRRHVTVLFADVSGFTTLSERLDPEEIRAFQNALFAKLAEAVARYDGFVEKFVGDAVMAVFGAPVAHENDPERALRAALDMLEASNVLSQEWATRLGQRVTLHIGWLGVSEGLPYRYSLPVTPIQNPLRQVPINATCQRPTISLTALDTPCAKCLPLPNGNS